MKNTLALGTLLLGCCLVAFGQTSNSSTSTSSDQSPGYSSQPGSSQGTMGAGSSGQTSTSSQGAMSANQGSQAAGKTSIRGCLSKGANGGFMLSATDGTSYQLSGDTAQLAAHVGHEVRLDGVQSSANPPGAMSASPSGQPQQQFSVSKVHHIASTCGAMGGSKSTGTGGGSSSGGGY